MEQRCRSKHLVSILKSCLAGIALCAVSATQAVQPRAVTLGLQPYLPTTQLQQHFTPLVDYLSALLGRPVEMRVAVSHVQLLNWIARDAVDIAFLGPANYIDLVQRYGPRPLLGRLEVAGKPSFEGTIFVRTDSPYLQLADLRGSMFAFGDEYSTMSYLVPRELLAQAGVVLYDLESYRFLGDQRNVALGVLAGDYQAGATRSDIYAHYRERGLRALASSPKVSEHVFVARQGIEAELETQLREILRKLHEGEDGRKVLQAIRSDVTGIVPANDGDYDSLRVLLAGTGQPFAAGREGE